MIVSDKGTEFTSNAIPDADQRSPRHEKTIADYLRGIATCEMQLPEYDDLTDRNKIIQMC
jgi:hypothetical protein